MIKVGLSDASEGQDEALHTEDHFEGPGPLGIFVSRVFSIPVVRLVDYEASDLDVELEKEEK